MARNPIDFFVLYNSPLGNEETDDTRLSTAFTRYLVKKLEDGKTRVGYCEFRDKVLGRNVFDVLNENVTRSRKTIVVLTSEFILNSWKKFASQTALKGLIDSGKTDNFIPIALSLSIREIKELPELSTKDWIHFEHDYDEDNAKNDEKWNLIRKAVDFEEPCTTNPVSDDGIPECGDNRLLTDERNLVTQPTECGDNRLLTDERNLVTQPTEFFSDSLIMDIAEKFPGNWKTLCIKLGLKDHKVDEIERNHQNDSGMQAFKGLKLSMISQGGNDENKLASLIKVFRNMRRPDIVEDVQKKYQEYQERNSQSNSCQSGTVQVVCEEQQNAQDDIPDSCMETKSLELKPLQTAAINPVQQSADLSPMSESVSMDAGTCISIPSASNVKLPSGPSLQLLSSQTPSEVPSSAVSKDSGQLYNAAHGDMKNQTSPSVVNSETSSVNIGQSGQNSENISNNSNISNSNQTSPQIKPMELVRHKENGDAYNGQRRETDNTALKMPFQNQCSLSNDDDITVDDGEASSIQQNGDQPTKSSAGNSNPLDQTEMLDLKSLDNDPVPTDSGLGSFANTPILENVPCSGSQTESVLNSSKTKENELNATEVEESIAPAMNQASTLELRSSNNGNTPPTDRNARNSSVVSKFCSMVWNSMTRPEYAYN